MSFGDLMELAFTLQKEKQAKRRKERRAGYHRRRLELIAFLGGVCKRCGESDQSKLEFHHHEKRTWQARKTSRWVRIARYWREVEAGIIELLCGDCNKAAGRPWLRKSDGEWVDEIGDNAPF